MELSQEPFQAFLSSREGTPLFVPGCLRVRTLSWKAQGGCERALLDAQPGDRFQFLRMGYFCRDPDTREGAPVFNRVVPLKDTWAKEAKK